MKTKNEIEKEKSLCERRARDGTGGHDWDYWVGFHDALEWAVGYTKLKEK